MRRWLQIQVFLIRPQHYSNTTSHFYDLVQLLIRFTTERPRTYILLTTLHLPQPPRHINRYRTYSYNPISWLPSSALLRFDLLILPMGIEVYLRLQQHNHKG